MFNLKTEKSITLQNLIESHRVDNFLNTFHTLNKTDFRIVSKNESFAAIFKFIQHTHTQTHKTLTHSLKLLLRNNKKTNNNNNKPKQRLANQ